MKETILAIVGVVGAFIAHAFGGWGAAMATLLIFMAIDYLTGLIVAGVFHNSPKSEGGALESKAASKGLIRKGMALLVVLIGARLDLLLGMNYIRDGIVIAFCVNELLSIVENMGLMGVPMPAPLMNAIELLKNKDDASKREGQADPAE
jgi:toxin secretion/phage lysis holin